MDPSTLEHSSAKGTDDIWKDDLLGRKEDARLIIDFLCNRITERGRLGEKRCFVLNVDAEWGEGKTFFIDRLERTIEHDGMLAVTINAWADDHADDPLIAVMSAIDRKINGVGGVSAGTKSAVKKLTEISGRVAVTAAKGIAKHAMEKAIGTEAAAELIQTAGGFASSGGREALKTIEEIYDAEGKKMFEKFSQGKRSISEFKSQLSKVLQTLKKSPQPPLFVLIDELDRCRPTYAIALLERTKHLFDVNDIIFLFATNADQLRHAIAATYGAGFDASRYLHRFFDQTYRFAEPNREAFVEAKLARLDATRLSQFPNTSRARFMLDGFNAFSLSLRDISQAFEILADCVTTWKRSVPLELAALLPLIIAQQQRLKLTFDISLTKRIEDARKSPAGSWNIKAAGLNRATGKPVYWNAMDLFARFGEMSHQKIFNVVNAEPSGTESIDYFVREAFMREVHSRQPINNKSKSWIALYPQLVRTVGRFTSTDLDYDSPTRPSS